MNKKLDNLISRLTLEEKAALCSGIGFWETTPISRVGIPAVMMTDGPHGVRKEIEKTVFGNIFQPSQSATCFPPAVTLASSWSREVAEEVGNAIGEECLDQGVSTILGPGINIKRSPLCGRNFEYFSEDPFLSGEMAVSYINGVQKNNVGTSLKHFAVNNQEYRRLVNSSEVDERALREIYLAGFEAAVKRAQPQTVMCSYNPINGIHASDNKKLLWDILREEWGFRGIVVSDWGAVNDRVKGIIAGMDLEMPSSNGIRDAEIVRAVKNGVLDIKLLDQMVKRILDYVFKCAEVKLETAGFIADYEKHHRLAKRACEEGAVLLKNEDKILPINSSSNFLVVGQLAKKPRYQGSGSSRLNPKRLVSFTDYLDSIEAKYSYAAGYSMRNDTKVKHIDHAVEKAKDKDFVLAFIGLTDSYESESFDREHLELPDLHNDLINALCAVNKNVIVILSGGSPVTMPWLDKVKGVLNIYLGGEAVGEATYDLIFGLTNPSGKLAETYPKSLSDVMSNHYFKMGPNTVEYRESIYVGYRYFDSAKKDVLFPFGYGLSYTAFEYSNISVSTENLNSNDNLTISFDVTNTGGVKGSEVCQLYVKDINSTVFKAEKELKAFDKIVLAAGETKKVTMTLDKRAFAFYNIEINDWYAEEGYYDIMIGASSRDIRLTSRIYLTSEVEKMPDYREKAPIYYDIENADEIPAKQFEALLGRPLVANLPRKKGHIDFNTTVKDIDVSWFGRIFKYIFLKGSLKAIPKNAPAFEKKMVQRGALDMPIRNFFAMSGGVVPYEVCEGLLMAFNGHSFRGIAKVIREILRKRTKKSDVYKK